MKKFIDPKGNYILFIPIEWGYKNGMYDAIETAPDSFELYEDSVGCFQISCNSINQGKIPVLIENNKLEPQKRGVKELNFTENQILAEKFDIYMWMAVIEDKFLMCKYIYDSDKRDNPKVLAEIKKAKKTLQTILFIEEKYKEDVLNSERFNKFMTSLGASLDLKNRAYENGSSIELVVLLANQIDALLRLTLILKKQIADDTNKIDTTLIYQAEADKPIMEKKVYQLALEQGIIDQNLYDELFDLYNKRNKVIHRYIITDLLTKDVMKIVYDYGIMQEKIGEVVKKYEQDQFKAKIGIYGIDYPPDTPLNELRKREMIGGLKEKHANDELNKGITFTL